MDEQELKSAIHYYGREKYYHAMETTAMDGLARFSTDASFRFYYGVSLVIGGRIQEGIRELTLLQSDRDIVLGAILALMYAHKQCAVIDKEALVALDEKLKDERKKATYIALYYAAVFLFLCGKTDKSKEYIDRALKNNANFSQGLTLKGWIETQIQIETGFADNTVIKYFDSAYNLFKTLDAALGQVKYFQIKREFETALTLLNKMIVRYPKSAIPLAEKMKVQLANWDWEQSLETAVRILSANPHSLDALSVRILILTCRDGNYDAAVTLLKQLYSAMDKSEPKNATLFSQTAQLFSRVCGRKADMLAETYRFAEHAAQINPASAVFITELGYQCLLQGKYKEALRFYKSATKVDDSSLTALCGLTLCQLAETGPSEQVSQQIEFLTEIQGSNTKPPLLLYMSAKLLTSYPEKAIPLLNEACEIHFKNLHSLMYGTEYLRMFDADFLLQVTKEYLQYSPTHSSVNTEYSPLKNLHISLKQSLNILEAVVKACPGLVEGVYQLAKVQFMSGETSLAGNTLQKILEDLDPTYADAHLLIAQIYINQDLYQKASQSLEICLSYNFKVRENPLYHLISGIVQKEQLQFDDSLRSFMTAMNLAGMKHFSPIKIKNKSSTYELSLSDKVTLYLELINAYVSQNQQIEAVKLMQDAIDEFRHTSEEGRVIIANAELSLQMGDTKKALTLLAGIVPGQPYYLQAHTKMAGVYLHHNKDRLAFAQCFRELVEHCPGPQSYVMLGDAYMSIQEPDRAIEAYEQAIIQNPSDAALASKMGRALVKTHQYSKAISYYKDAITSSENSHLKLDMAELYMKLKQYKDAEKTLMDELEATKSVLEDLSLLQTRTKQLLLLSRVREKDGNLVGSLSCLKEARDNQHRVQKRVALEQSTGALPDQRRLSSHICVLMAEQCCHLRDTEQAILHYKEALKFTPQDATTLASLARLYMQVNNLDQCQQTCSVLLQSEPNNEVASVMMADLAFRKVDFENAAFHFSQLLLAQPTYWTALARLLEVMRRSATLNDAPPFIERAEQACIRPSHEPGLSYCKALYEWYTGNPNAALRHFNNARRDPEWGQQSIYNMIEICLHPDDDILSEANVDILDDPEYRDSRSMALRTAERLLKELKPRLGGMDNEALNHRLLGNFLLLATRQKMNIERALQDFTAIASQHEYRDHVGPILGMASAYMLQKVTQRAKNQLKRVAKSPWTFEDAQYLEQCWLLLADFYVQSGKYELSGELLKRVLQHNKSCTKAYELSGFIAEKEQSYRAAAIQYDFAWKYGGKSNPSIGYRLAYNHMKTKKYGDAIDVCQQVLKLHPDYPRLKKDILDKCKINLRS